MNTRDGRYPCDYGHNHLTATAKGRCEDRNDTRGLPRAAQLAKMPPGPAKPDKVDYWGRWRA